MKMQEDLATLFARNMMVGDPSESAQLERRSATRIPDSNTIAHPITYSITRHYNHSTHQAPAVIQQTEAKPLVPQINEVSPEEALLRNNVDPSSLFPSQLTLFKQAEPDQKLRLIELWRIYPQVAQRPQQESGAWNATGARQDQNIFLGGHAPGLDRNAGTSRFSSDDETMVDGMEEDLRSMHGGDRHAEPYMVSGYETLAKRDYELSAGLQPLEHGKLIVSPPGSAVGGQYSHSTDPVYNQPDPWKQSLVHQVMENQYGAFQQQNHYGPSKPSHEGGYAEDEEML